MSKNEERVTFARLQAEMSATWAKNARQRGVDMEALHASRAVAYLDRWKEAARFIGNGSRVLDIGGGNTPSIVMEFLKERQYKYQYIDVDPAAAKSSKDLAQTIGFKSAKYDVGFNDKFDYADSMFDAVFSSHCLEHSIDLAQTFSELWRVIVSGGNLAMAVPFGWETNDAHPYFLSVQEWATLIMDAGFKIRVSQVGCEYPENGYDLFICGRRLDSRPETNRLRAEDYSKRSYTFIPFNDSCIDIEGGHKQGNNNVVMLGSAWGIRIRVPESGREVLPIFARHPWSGIVEANWGATKQVEDLFSWFTYIQPMRISRGNSVKDAYVHCRPIGKNSSSYASEGVFFGVMIR